MEGYLSRGIEILKGLGPEKAALLTSELGIKSLGDLLFHFPFRYEDRTLVHKISEIDAEMPFCQLRGTVSNFQMLGEGRKSRLTALFRDETGSVELVWFGGAQYIERSIKSGIVYQLYGKPTAFNGRINISHPELSVWVEGQDSGPKLVPVYQTSEKLKKKYVDSKAIGKLTQQALSLASKEISENLPADIRERYRLIDRVLAFQHIHWPTVWAEQQRASLRLKFEELFFVQLKVLKGRSESRETHSGFVFSKAELLTKFYKEHLPFPLTDAQIRVLREIRTDMRSGKQMNRLLQGDVGSGKTIVGFIAMLMAIDNGCQAALMAPTEILAEQHYRGLAPLAALIGIRLELLTGSTKTKDRKRILDDLELGNLPIIVGTHALLEDRVKFQQLGVCIIDEQHRFGVAQRSRLWNKNEHILPHILVMTATPIPRTLAMTLYGDLDVSVIDQLPPGRKPINTVHRYETQRNDVYRFVKDEVAKGRQVYIVYPLIAESEKLDFKALEEGYRQLEIVFPRPQYTLSMVHGRLKNEDRDREMNRFLSGESQILVATTVIEVGVNVPNASLMLIESAERFGLSQLHQLRGRVGRGAEQSYCILMTDHKLSRESRLRMQTMCSTNNGFEIAEVDLKLRGPGDMAGTRQSGMLDLRLADLVKDNALLIAARTACQELLEQDPLLTHPHHQDTALYLMLDQNRKTEWSRIS